jgi:hypothetical protein
MACSMALRGRISYRRQAVDRYEYASPVGALSCDRDGSRDDIAVRRSTLTRGVRRIAEGKKSWRFSWGAAALYVFQQGEKAESATLAANAMPAASNFDMLYKISI